MPDFLPRRDSALLEWAKAFRARLNTDAGALGVSPELVAVFDQGFEEFALALRVAKNPMTAVRSATLRKTEKRDAMTALIRTIAAQVRANPALGSEQRINLGLPPRRRRRRHAPKPRTAPSLLVRSTLGQVVRLDLNSADGSGRRGRPEGVIGAAIFAHVGAQPPASPAAWCLKRFATRRSFNIRMGTDLPPGTTVWLYACWLNARLRQGPPSLPICINIPGSVSTFPPPRALAA